MLEAMSSGFKSDPEGTTFRLHEDQELKIVFSAIGVDPPSSDDVQAFNTAIPNLSIELTSRDSPLGASHFVLSVRAKLQKLPDGRFTELSGADATAYCLTQAIHFVSAFAVATNTVVVWRELKSCPVGISGMGTGMSDRIQFTEQYKVFERGIQLHAGHLYKSIEIYGRLQVRNWPERFHELYQKGMMLLAIPELPGLSFLEESYQCFYKCIEYLVMAKILNRKGQYESKFLPKAFETLGIEPSDSDDHFKTTKKTADALGAKRGNVVSHFVKGMESVSLTPNEVFELKSMLDFMIRAYQTKQL